MKEDKLGERCSSVTGQACKRSEPPGGDWTKARYLNNSRTKSLGSEEFFFPEGGRFKTRASFAPALFVTRPRPAPPLPALARSAPDLEVASRLAPAAPDLATTTPFEILGVLLPGWDYCARVSIIGIPRFVVKDVVLMSVVTHK